jgi:hypothetical protein
MRDWAFAWAAKSNMAIKYCNRLFIGSKIANHRENTGFLSVKMRDVSIAILIVIL